MEGVTCKRGWHDPFMMRLMQPLVKNWMVQRSMYPVHEEVREGYEKRELEEVVQRERSVSRGIV